MSDIGEISGAIRSIGDLVGGVLSRADRDAPEKELNENTTKVQNSFASNNLDEQWAMAYRLFNSSGSPLTPGLVGKDGDREFKHRSLLIAAELIYAKRIIARLVAKSVKE